MTPLLLDTHVFIWWCEDSPRISGETLDSLRAPESRIFLSAVSVWEMIIKARKGKLTLPNVEEGRIRSTITEAAHSYGFVELPISFRHAEAVTELPRYHGDPFDQMLVAQAQVENLTLVTHDKAFAAYDVPILWT